MWPRYQFVSIQWSYLKEIMVVTLHRFVSEFKIWIVGVPVCLSHTKYPRNALIFNMGLIVDSEHPMLETYFPSIDDCARKLSNYLTSLERECEYLFNQTHNTMDSTSWIQENGSLPLPDLMQRVVDSLNTNHMCQVNIDSANTIFIRLYPVIRDPESVMLHHVPVPIITYTDHIQSREKLFWDEIENPDRPMDIGMKKILPFIDGSSYVKKIAFQADMDLDLVVKAIKHLLYYGFVGLVDIFQYSNRYMVTQEIMQLYTKESLQNAAIQAVALDSTQEAPTIQSLFKLYALFNANREVKHICEEIKKHGYNVDVKKLVSFGVLNNIIRRLHPYPVGMVQQSQELSSTFPPIIHQMVDGKHPMDEIAVTLNMSFKELESYFDKFIYM